MASTSVAWAEDSRNGFVRVYRVNQSCLRSRPAARDTGDAERGAEPRTASQGDVLSPGLDAFADGVTVVGTVVTDPNDDDCSSCFSLDFGALAHRYGALRNTAAACEYLRPYLGSSPFESYEQASKCQSMPESAVLLCCDIGGDPEVASLVAHFDAFLCDIILSHTELEGHGLSCSSQNISKPNATQLESDIRKLSRRELFVRAKHCDQSNFIDTALRSVASSVARALSFLHDRGLFHGLLTPDDLHCTSVCEENATQGQPFMGAISMSGYAIYHLIEQKDNDASAFLIKGQSIRYAPPEHLLLDPFDERGMNIPKNPNLATLLEESPPSQVLRPQGDSWSLGLILAQLVGLFEPIDGHKFQNDVTRLSKLLELGQREQHKSYFEQLSSECDDLAPDFCDFVARCLYIDPVDRDTAKMLCSHPFVCESIANSTPSVHTRVASYRDTATSQNLFLELSGLCPDFLINATSGRFKQTQTSYVATADIFLPKLLPVVQSGTERTKSTSLSGAKSGTETNDKEPDSSSTDTQNEKDSGVTPFASSTATMIAALIFEKAGKSLSDNEGKERMAAKSDEACGGDASVENGTADSSESQSLSKSSSDWRLDSIVELQEAMYAANLRFEDEHTAKRLQSLSRMLSLAVAKSDESDQDQPQPSEKGSHFGPVVHTHAARSRTLSVSTSFRGLLWVSLLNLGVPIFPRGTCFDAFAGGPVKLYEPSQLKYQMIEDKLDIPHEVDHQLEQDVPRCHQYHPLVRSPSSQRRLYRLLKGWLLLNPDCQYWQGLDSVAAVVLTLYPGNEPVALAVFDRIVALFLPDMFSKSNNRDSQLLHGQMQVLSQLLYFHDPTLALHLDKLGVKPDLFAIPWMLTMFAHVLPVPLTYAVWDYILADPANKRGLSTLLLAVSVLVQLRYELLEMSEFGYVVAFLTRLPVSLEQLVTRGLQLAHQAAKLTPDFFHSTWESQLNTQWPTPIDYVCPIMTCAEFASKCQHIVLVDCTGIASSAKEKGVILLGHGKIDLPFQYIVPAGSTDELAHVSRLVGKRLDESCGGRWIVAIAHGDSEQMMFLIDALITVARRPFVCVLEPKTFATLEKPEHDINAEFEM